ncbi:TPA: hypothetical protein ACJIWP_000077 [Enterobacter cloacae]
MQSVPKRQNANSVAVDVGFSGGSAAPRSSVNNYTQETVLGADNVENLASELAEQLVVTLPIEDVTVNLHALSRQGKRELAQRLSDDM